jgi:GT2 family glycosyltransferase
VRSNTLAIMPTYMGKESELEMTKKAIKTLLGTCDADLMVIDDGSPNRELVNALLCWEALENQTRFELRIKHENEGFSKTVNVGMRTALQRGQNALLVNADVEFFRDDWLKAMEGNQADVVGALLLFPNGLVQHAGVYFSVITRAPDHIYRMAPRTLAQVHEPRICPVTGALMLIKHATMEKIGVFDEGFGMGFEDVDYCYTAFREGLTCAYEPSAQAIHHESVFRHAWPNDKRLAERWRKSFEYLHEKHKGWEFSDFVPTMLWDER